MSTPDLSAFNFSFDPTLDTWAVSDEPAELDSSEIFLPNVEGRTEFLPPDPDRVPVIENSVRTDDPAYAARPADERTHELLSQMRPHRATLLGILAACEAPMATSAMKEAVERISGRKFSVYTPSNFCTMLEVAGGLARVTDAGEPYTDEVRAPEQVEVDGRTFWRPTTPPPVYWQTTEAGATVLAEDDPAARIERLFAKEPESSPCTSAFCSWPTPKRAPAWDSCPWPSTPIRPSPRTVASTCSISWKAWSAPAPSFGPTAPGTPPMRAVRRWPARWPRWSTTTKCPPLTT